VTLRQILCSAALALALGPVERCGSKAAVIRDEALREARMQVVDDVPRAGADFL